MLKFLKSILSIFVLSVFSFAYGQQVINPKTDIGDLPSNGDFPGYGTTSSFKVIFTNQDVFAINANSLRLDVIVPLGLDILHADLVLPSGWEIYRRGSIDGSASPQQLIITNTSEIAPLITPGFVSEFLIPVSVTGSLTEGANIIAYPTVLSNATQTYTLSQDAQEGNSATITIADVPLSVEFSELAVNANNCLVNVEWITLAESNNSHFLIERSADGKHYTSIGRVNGAGNSKEAIKYSFVDEAPLNGENFYRVRQVDFDLKSSVSNVKKALSSCFVDDINIYPNPAKDIVYVRGIRNKSTIHVYNVVGQLVMSKDAQNNLEGLNLSGLASGTYQVNILQGDQVIYNGKIILNK